MDSLFSTVGSEMDDVVQASTGQGGGDAPVTTPTETPTPTPPLNVVVATGNLGSFSFVEDPARLPVYLEADLDAVCTSAGFSGAATTCGSGSDDPEGLGCGGNSLPSYWSDLVTQSGETDFNVVGRRYAAHSASPAECGLRVVNSNYASWCTCNGYRTTTAENCSGDGAGWTNRQAGQDPIFVMCAP